MITALTKLGLDDCVPLYVETFGAPPWNESWRPADVAQRLGDMLATPRALGVCATAPGGGVAGFALGHLERSDGADHFLLQEMCVRAALRRRGHGSALLQALADRMPDVRQWYLLTTREGPAAEFYVRNGFRPARRMGVFVRP